MSAKPLAALIASLMVVTPFSADAQRRRSSRRSRRAPTTQTARASGTGPGPFQGVWSVASNTEVSVTTPVIRTESRQTRERVEIGPGAGADLELQVTNERGESCRLRANRRGANITLLPAQQCFFTDAVQGITFAFTLQQGTGALRGSSLSLDFSWAVFANVGMVIHGTAQQHSTGTLGGAGIPMPSPIAPTPSPVAPAGIPTW